MNHDTVSACGPLRPRNLDEVRVTRSNTDCHVAISIALRDVLTHRHSFTGRVIHDQISIQIRAVLLGIYRNFAVFGGGEPEHVAIAGSFNRGLLAGTAALVPNNQWC